MLTQTTAAVALTNRVADTPLPILAMAQTPMLPPQTAAQMRMSTHSPPSLARLTSARVTDVTLLKRPQTHIRAQHMLTTLLTPQPLRPSTAEVLLIGSILDYFILSDFIHSCSQLTRAHAAPQAAAAMLPRPSHHVVHDMHCLFV